MGHMEALEADLARWGPAVSGSALAAVALGLAARLDDPETSGGQAAQLARELRATVLELLRLAPAAESSDDLTKLRERRSKRRGAG